MCLMNNVVVQDATGKCFVVGLDCARKTGDTKLITEAQALEKARQRQLRAAKAEQKRRERIAAYEVELQAQRDRNGGMTDDEIEKRNRLAEREANRAKYTELNGWILDALHGGGSFIADMAEKLSSSPIDSLSDRQLSIICDIYGKSHGRRNSKAYTAAVDEFEARVMEMTGDSP